MNVIVKDIEERIDEDSVERLAQLTENMIPEWNCRTVTFNIEEFLTQREILVAVGNFFSFSKKKWQNDIIEGMKASRFSRRRAGREGRKGTGIGVAPEVLDEVRL